MESEDASTYRAMLWSQSSETDPTGNVGATRPLCYPHLIVVGYLRKVDVKVHELIRDVNVMIRLEWQAVADYLLDPVHNMDLRKEIHDLLNYRLMLHRLQNDGRHDTALLADIFEIKRTYQAHRLGIYAEQGMEVGTQSKDHFCSVLTCDVSKVAFRLNSFGYCTQSLDIVLDTSGPCLRAPQGSCLFQCPTAHREIFLRTVSPMEPPLSKVDDHWDLFSVSNVPMLVGRPTDAGHQFQFKTRLLVPKKDQNTHTLRLRPSHVVTKRLRKSKDQAIEEVRVRWWENERCNDNYKKCICTYTYNLGTRFRTYYDPHQAFLYSSSRPEIDTNKICAVPKYSFVLWNKWDKCMEGWIRVLHRADHEPYWRPITSVRELNDVFVRLPSSCPLRRDVPLLSAPDFFGLQRIQPGPNAFLPMHK